MGQTYTGPEVLKARGDDETQMIKWAKEFTSRKIEGMIDRLTGATK
jgi:hypothetical protein